jgi:uncharacterized protein (TIGR03084 family)
MSGSYESLQGFTYEAERLTGVLESALDQDWTIETPATGWSVADQVAHLTSVYRLAAQAVRDPDRFTQLLAGMTGSFEDNVAALMAPLSELPNGPLFDVWLGALEESTAALRSADADQIVPWLVRPIPARVLAMAGMAEAFGHGQDIYDALEAEHVPHDHVLAVCEFAYHTSTFGYLARGLQPPTTPLRFELESPSGRRWTLGDPQAADLVCGKAWDLALLVTRRRHPADLDLFPTGPFACEWIGYAQAYRGPAGPGREPVKASVGQ